MTDSTNNKSNAASGANSKTSAWEVGTIVHVAPSTLLLARNIREAKPDADLVRSVKDVGVLEPITAVVTADDALLVRYGHRRTLAAVEAGDAPVPVYIAGADSDTKADEIVRVVSQRDENTHRTGLTTAEDVGVVEQLAAFGMSPAQIAKKARIKRADVDTALTVAGSALAKGVTERHESLTLDQAAVIAEFEDDTETVKALMAATKTGQFDHVAQRARQARDKARAVEALTSTLTEAGVTVVSRPLYSERPKRLDSLKTEGTPKSGGGADITTEDHAHCPGHIAWIESAWVDVDKHGNPLVYPDEPTATVDEDEAAWQAYEDAVERIDATSRRVEQPVAVYGCDNPAANGHRDRFTLSSSTGSSKPKAADMSEAEREATRKARALVIENNKAWVAAEDVRREWLADFAKRKTPPKGSAAFIATALCHDHHDLASVGGNEIAANLLGVKHIGYGWADLSPAKTATENRALVVALVQVLGGYEAGLTKDSWRSNGTTNGVGRYLRFIEICGYNLSDVEKYAISKKTA